MSVAREYRLTDAHGVEDQKRGVVKLHFTWRPNPGYRIEYAYIYKELRAMNLLHNLTDASVNQLVIAFKALECMPGEVVMGQGDAITDESMFYFIDEGTVDVLIDGVLVVKREKGSYFGETGLLEDTPRSATVMAGSSTCHLLCMPRKNFRKLANLDEKIRQAFDFRVAEVTRDTANSKLKDAASGTTTASSGCTGSEPGQTDLEESERAAPGTPPSNRNAGGLSIQIVKGSMSPIYDNRAMDLTPRSDRKLSIWEQAAKERDGMLFLNDVDSSQELDWGSPDLPANVRVIV
jgi:CRP-like cAMP-binding protein